MPSGYDYVNYFISHVLEFQLHKSVCKVAGQLENGAPLHKCDIDGSREVGNLLAAGMSAGASRHWSETLKVMTGDSVLKSDAMLEYFAPLMAYLKKVNEEWKAPGTADPDTEDPDTDDPDTADPDTDDPDTEDPDSEHPDTHEPGTEEELPMVPIIVGSVIGGVVVLGVVVASIYYVCKRNARPASFSNTKSV